MIFRSSLHTAQSPFNNCSFRLFLWPKLWPNETLRGKRYWGLIFYFGLTNSQTANPRKRARASLLLIYLLALQLGHCFLHTNNIMWVSLPQQLLALASTFHKASILLFGYFVPALSSVKGMRIEWLMHLLCLLLCLQPSNWTHCTLTLLLHLLYTAVVRKDSEAYQQWTT